MTDYDTEAKRLILAIDIAIDSFEKFPPPELDEAQLNWVIHVYRFRRDLVEHPEPQFRALDSLNYMIHDVLTYFQEAKGNIVEYFWHEIEANGLQYVREDLMRKILERGHLINDIEWNYAKDQIVEAAQMGRITDAESKQLGRMIYEFEFGERS